MINDIDKTKFPVVEEEIKQEFTLKLLFGPMFGCELNLPADDYFLLINPGTPLQDNCGEVVPVQKHAAHYALNTLYIPCDIPSPNIIICLTNPQVKEDGNNYLIEVHAAEGGFQEVIKENKVFSCQHIHIAVKKNEDQWSEEVINFNKPSSADNNDSVRSLSERLLLLTGSKEKKMVSTFMLCCFLVILAVLSLSWYKKIESAERVSTLSEALSGAPDMLTVLQGLQQDKIFVLAQGLPEMEWATEALHKLNIKPDVELIWLQKHKQALVKRLVRDEYPVLQLDYDEPQHPIVALYRELQTEEENRFKALLLEKSPFASDVRIIVRTKTELLQEARQGLDRLHITYREIDTQSGYAMIVNDRLSDNVLAALSNFIKSFSQKWGSNIVSFSVNLDENWLQNKSWVDRSNGYIFLSPKHWYFPHADK